MYLASVMYVLLALLALAFIRKRQSPPTPKRKGYSRSFFLKQMPREAAVPDDYVAIEFLKKPKRCEIKAKRFERFEGRSKGRAVEERPEHSISFGSFAELDTYEEIGTRDNSFMASPVTHELDMSMFEVKSVLDLSHDKGYNLSINAPAFVPKSLLNPEVAVFVPRSGLVVTHY